MVEAFKLLGEIMLEGARGVQQDLEKLQKKVEDTQQKFKDWGETVRATGEGLSQYIALPLTALGVGAMVSATQFGDSQAMMQAQLGLTGEEAKKLSDVAQGVWSNGFGENLDEATNAVSNLYATLGDIPQGELHAITEGVLTLTKAFGIDQVEATTAVSTVMKNFGVTGEQALDLITFASQKTSGVFRADLSDALTELAPTLHAMGANGEEAFNLLITASKSGMENFDGLSSLTQTFADNMIGGGKEIEGAFDRIGGKANSTWEAYKKGNASAYEVMLATSQQLGEISDSTTRNQVGAQLFGDVWTEAGQDAIIALGGAGKTLEGVEGASHRAGTALAESFGQRFQSFLRQAQTSLEPLGLVLIDIAEKVLPPLVQGLTNVATWFSNLSTGSQFFIVALGILATIIPPIVMAVGMMAQGIGVLVPWVVKAWSIFGKLRLAFLAMNPIVLAVVAVIGALVLIGIKVYQNWDKISAWLSKTWEGMKKKASEFADGVSKKVEEMKTKASTAVTNLKNSMSTAWDNVKSKAQTTWQNIKDSIWRPIEEAKNKVEGIVSKIKSFFTNLKLSIPKPSLPSLPKFSLATSTKDIMGKRITYPTGFNVKWNAQGAYVDGATLIGAGEAGGEGIVPLEGRHMIPIAQKIAEFIGAGQTALAGAGSARLEIPLIVNGREITRAIIPNIDQELQRQRTLRKRGL